MLIQEGRTHLSYCTNVHPSESWTEVEACLRHDVLAVKKLVSPDADFGVGLRLSARAASELLKGNELPRLVALLKTLGLYVFTINGFPYGPFHGQTVKQDVYLPDWRSPERALYTDALRTILGALLETGQTGSISTVPGGFRPLLQGEGDRETVARAWLREAGKLHEQETRSGKSIVLAIEPEPSCMLETTAELVNFFKQHLLTNAAFQWLASGSGLSLSLAESAVRRHLGICLDTCHAAVEFEDANESLDLLEKAGIVIGKIQLSSGLRVPSFDADAAAALPDFNDEIYLHQVVIQGGGELTRYVDLPEALAHRGEHTGSEWRVHFHVPIFRERFGSFQGTQALLKAILARQSEAPVTTHLEVETYTWGVLPSEYQGASVAESVSRELTWARKQLTS
jgi:sugar phosphate isomerase/epimerase